MKRLTTTFRGMEFIKILLEALGWNAFPLVKWELQLSVACREAQDTLRNISATETVQRLLHNYQLFDPFPAPAPETISGLGEKTSPQTLGRPEDQDERGEWKPEAKCPHPTLTSLTTSEWGLAQGSKTTMHQPQPMRPWCVSGGPLTHSSARGCPAGGR